VTAYMLNTLCAVGHLSIRLSVCPSLGWMSHPEVLMGSP